MGGDLQKNAVIALEHRRQRTQVEVEFRGHGSLHEKTKAWGGEGPAHDPMASGGGLCCHLGAPLRELCGASAVEASFSGTWDSELSRIFNTDPNGASEWPPHVVLLRERAAQMTRLSGDPRSRQASTQGSPKRQGGGSILWD